MWDSLSWRERIVFFGILEVFLSQCGYNWCKNLESQNFLRRILRKWPFAFQVYTKKIQEQLSEFKEFKNWFICIISEVQGAQEFQEFLRSSRTGLFAYLNIQKSIFIENYFNLIILNIQHSASRFAQQQKKEDTYVQNLANLFHQHQQINRTIKLLTNKQKRISVAGNLIQKKCRWHFFLCQ